MINGMSMSLGIVELSLDEIDSVSAGANWSNLGTASAKTCC